MAVETKDQLKQYFETLDRPTQQQFFNLIESLRHENDKIDIDDLEANLKTIIQNIQPPSNNNVEVLAAGTTYYDLPSGVDIWKFKVFTESEEIVFKIGTTNGGNDVLDVMELPANSIAFINVDIGYRIDKRIYFGGVVADTVIKIFKG